MRVIHINMKKSAELITRQIKNFLSLTVINRKSINKHYESIHLKHEL